MSAGTTNKQNRKKPYRATPPAPLPAELRLYNQVEVMQLRGCVSITTLKRDIRSGLLVQTHVGANGGKLFDYEAVKSYLASLRVPEPPPPPKRPVGRPRKHPLPEPAPAPQAPELYDDDFDDEVEQSARSRRVG